MMSFETKWIAFFDAKLSCFLPHLHFPTKAVQYANETLSFQDKEYGLHNDLNIFIKYQHSLCKHSDSPGFVSTLVAKRQRG